MWHTGVRVDTSAPANHAPVVAADAASYILNVSETHKASVGLLAGTLAAGGASTIGYLLATRVFELSYTPSALLWIGGLLGGAAIVGVSGTLAVRSVVNQSPVATLRGA